MDRGQVRDARTSTKGWHYGTSFDGGVDFCLWALERDGLQVPPIDRHPDADGSLRAAGLDADAWLAWLRRTVAAMDERAEVLQRRPPDLDRLRALQPERLWQGSAAVARRLEQLDELYGQVFNRRKRTAELEFHPLAVNRRLWDALAPYRRATPPLQIALTAYPGPTRLAVPPATLILAAGGWYPSQDQIIEQVGAGTAELAANCPPGGPTPV